MNEPSPRIGDNFIGALAGRLRATPSRAAAGASGARERGRGNRIPSQAEIDGLLQDGLLVLPARYFRGDLLDLLI